MMSQPLSMVHYSRRSAADAMLSFHTSEVRLQRDDPLSREPSARHHNTSFDGSLFPHSAYSGTASITDVPIGGLLA